MNHSTMHGKKNGLLSAAAVLFWLLVWQGLAMMVDSPILLVSPVETLKRFVELLPKKDFWQSVGFSTGRILLGFVIGSVSAALLSVLSYRFSIVRIFLKPLLVTVKSIPVASFIILVLLWVPGRALAVVISAMIGFPVVYGELLRALDGTDPKLIEMADLFQVPFGRRLRDLLLPGALPHLSGALGTAMGLCWKSGVAAEIIALPTGSLGERLYRAKIYLETPDLFCCTLTVVILSALCEKGLKHLLARLCGGQCAGGKADD